MISQVATGAFQIQRTRRGLSLYDNNETKSNRDIRAPIFYKKQLIDTLQLVINETTKSGKFESITSRVQGPLK